MTEVGHKKDFWGRKHGVQLCTSVPANADVDLGSETT